MKIKSFITVISLITLLLFTFCTIKIAFADEDNDDFSQNDYKRALNADKNLSNAKLKKANLQGANLNSVNLSGADLEKANLQGADLTNANLQDADLEEANLKGAKIDGAKFKGAELEYAVWPNGRVCGEGSVSSCW